MAKKSNKLSLDFSCPTAVVGIACVKAFYELAHHINKKLGISLVRRDDVIQSYSDYSGGVNSSRQINLFSSTSQDDMGQNETAHPLYFYEDDERKMGILLIQNTVNGNSLIGKAKGWDYLFILNNVIGDDISKYIAALSEINCINATILLDEKKIPNLRDIFDDLDTYIIEQNRKK